MAVKAYLTDAGAVLLNKLLASRGRLEYVRAELGDGRIDADFEQQTALVNKVCDASMVGVKYNGDTAQITIQYSNAGAASGFYVYEAGVYCKDPDTAADVLYCYVSFGSTPDWIGTQSDAGYLREYDIATQVAEGLEITVNITPGALVSVTTLNEALDAADVGFYIDSSGYLCQRIEGDE